MTTEELLDRAKDLIEIYGPGSLHMLPELVAEIERLQHSAYELESEKRLFAANADYWCKEYMKLQDPKYDCPQGIKCPYLQNKEADYKNLKSAWQKMFTSKQLVLGDLEKTKERLNYSELLREAQANQIERQETRIEALENNQTMFYVVSPKEASNYLKRLETEFLKVYSRMFWYENSWEGEYSFDCDAVAREYLAGIKSRHL